MIRPATDWRLYRKSHWPATTLCLLVAVAALFLSQLPNDTRSEWFRSLIRPEILPRGLERKIGLIWTTIFLLAGLGTAASMAADQPQRSKSFQLGLIGACFVFNLLYTYSFTYQHNLHLATGIAAALASVLLLLLITVARRRVWIALACHAPHFVWVCFATYVTVRMAQLNS